MNYSSEEADEVFEVANAIPVNRSTKAIPINILCFLFIVTKILIRSDSDSCFSNVA